MLLSRMLAWLRDLPAIVMVLASVFCGCGYTSEYVAPGDGRARALWRENNVVFDPGGGSLSSPCAQAVMQLSSSPHLRLPREYVVTRAESGYWVPRYYGPSIIVVNPGIAPSLPTPPLFLPSLGLHAVPRLAPTGLGGLGHVGGGGGGSLGGGDGGKLLVVLAVIALVVLPAIDLGLALARPESEDRSSQAIDQVNAYNDLARSLGSPCSYEALAGGAL